MSYDPKRLIDPSEHGSSYELIRDSISWLIKEAKNKGFGAQIKAKWLVEGTTRFANSQVTQHSDLNTISFSLKLSVDKQFASASSSLLTKDGMNSLFKQVEQSIKSTPPISFYQGLPLQRDGSTVDLSGREWTMEDRADAIIAAANEAEEVNKDVITAGVATESKNYTMIVNTEGIDVDDAVQKNYFKINAICGEPDQRGYGQEDEHWRYDKPNYEDLARSATQTAVDTIKLIDLEAPKDYEVLLAPQAVSDLMVYVLFSLDATSFHESNSFATDRLGDQVFDEKLTLENLPRNPKQVMSVGSFDGEGIPTSNQMVVDQGVLKFIPYNSFYAAKYLDDKSAATGNTFSLPWGESVIPISVSVTPGNTRIESQISEMKDGLYVKNFWYNRFTLQREGALTGLTRNGLYHVKDGEIQGAVRNLRYTESFLNAFGSANVISVSKERQRYTMTTVPSLHLEKFHFSSMAHSKD